ncbi:hypothetical protein [Nostoc sp.]|uniref:hypothetical protein n=1 Tax=Nostoc sp. TaxID=1180 RepID=UPI002FF6054A
MILLDCGYKSKKLQQLIAYFGFDSSIFIICFEANAKSAVAPHYEVSQCDGVPAHFIAIAPGTSHISSLRNATRVRLYLASAKLEEAMPTVASYAHLAPVINLSM